LCLGAYESVHSRTLTGEHSGTILTVCTDPWRYHFNVLHWPVTVLF